MHSFLSYKYNFSLECIKNSDVKINHKYTLGDLNSQTFCVRYDPNDKYIAAGKILLFEKYWWLIVVYTGCGDGSIRIFNVYTGKQSYVLNANMDEPMPTTQIR